MNKQEDHSLFIVQQTMENLTTQDRAKFLSEEGVELYVQEILNFLNIKTPQKKTEYSRVVEFLSHVVESLSLGNMAYFQKNEDMEAVLNILLSMGLAEVFFQETPENFRLTEKFLVVVQKSCRTGAYIYLQKQWNTYLRLQIQINQRLIAMKEETWDNPSWGETEPLDHLSEEQKNAVRGVLSSYFSMVLGGPGTGKTTVVSSIVEGIFAQNPAAHIALLTPTGRASGRLKESLKTQWQSRSLDVLENRLEVEFAPRTIERFLFECKKFTEPQFPDEKTLFPELDFLLIDEISMVSPFLFAELLGTISYKTKVILLGDPDQLPSVSEGFLLGYFLDSHGPFPKIFFLHTLMRAQSGDLGKIITYLQTQFHSLSSYVPNFSQLGEVQNLNFETWKKSLSIGEGVFFLELMNEDEESIEEILQIYVKKYFLSKGIREKVSENLEEIFETFYQSQFLSPTKQGIMGVNHVNAVCQKELRYRGQGEIRPVIVEKNQEQRGLFNGDLGLLWESGGREIVHFPQGKEWYVYDKARVQECQNCFAMTVHKAQGSEFEEIFLFLPSYAISQILSREIFYTAISRAKKKVIIISRRDVLESVLHHKSSRENGLPLLMEENF